MSKFSHVINTRGLLTCFAYKIYYFEIMAGEKIREYQSESSDSHICDFTPLDLEGCKGRFGTPGNASDKYLYICSVDSLTTLLIFFLLIA
jgi:hypothetical protein